MAWLWNLSLSGFDPDPGITIEIVHFSAAAHVFDLARSVFESTRARFGKGDPLVIWLGAGVDWDGCEACFWNVPVNVFGVSYGSQVFVNGGPDNEIYWGDSAIVHELGHYVMATFGHEVGEGGPHCIDAVSPPGIAWSEGFATWFSVDFKNDSRYAYKSSGAWLYRDLTTRAGGDWPRADASYGLGQAICETEIASMMWNISKTQGFGRGPMDAALASPRMKTPPFEREYLRKRFDGGPNCTFQNVVVTSQNTTMFADFLDALRCNGLAASVVDNATNPAANYPYDSGAPKCRH